MRVCQVYFLRTFDTSETMIKILVLKKQDIGTIKEDQRGFATPPTTLDEERTKTVVDHTMLFRTVESHYICKDLACQYLPEYQIIAEMYRII